MLAACSRAPQPPPQPPQQQPPPAPVEPTGSPEELASRDELGNRAGAWTLSTLAIRPRWNGWYQDVVVVGDTTWLLITEQVSRYGAGRVLRLRDGEEPRTTPLADGAARLVAQPEGVAVLEVHPGRVTVTWLDGEGRLTGASTIRDAGPQELSVLRVTGRPGGGVALFGEARGHAVPFEHSSCAVIVVDGRGVELARHELTPRVGPGPYRCRPAGIVAVDDDLVLAVQTDEPLPSLGLAGPVTTSTALVVRLAADGTVRWRRELSVAGGRLELGDLARARATALVVGVITDEPSAPGLRVDLGPTTRWWPRAPAVPAARVALLGLDLDTGRSRWLDVVDAPRVEPDRVHAGGGEGGLGVAVRPREAGTIAGLAVDAGAVFLAGLDERAGARRDAAVLDGDGGVMLSGVTVAADGAVHVAGGFRGSLALGGAVASVPPSVSFGCDPAPCPPVPDPSMRPFLAVSPR